MAAVGKGLLSNLQLSHGHLQQAVQDHDFLMSLKVQVPNFSGKSMTRLRHPHSKKWHMDFPEWVKEQFPIMVPHLARASFQGSCRE